VIYGRDAFADLRFMDALMEAKAAEAWDDRQGSSRVRRRAWAWAAAAEGLPRAEDEAAPR
jgi:type IV secretory pathway TrbF-like protein